MNEKPYGLEQLATRHAADAANFLRGLIEDLQAYNNQTGVVSPLTTYHLEEQPILQRLPPVLKVFEKLASHYHYYRIHDASRSSAPSTNEVNDK